MDKLFSPRKSGKGQHVRTHSRKDSGQYYFVQRQPGVTSSVRDKGDEDAVIEVNRGEHHAHDDTYDPKPVNRSLSLVRKYEYNNHDIGIRRASWGRLFSLAFFDMFFLNEFCEVSFSGLFSHR